MTLPDIPGDTVTLPKLSAPVAVPRRTFGQWLDARWKAVVGLLVPVIVGYAGVILVDPETTTQLQGVLPDALKWLVPPLVGIATSLLVHTTPNVQE